MIVMVNDRQVEADEQTTVAALLTSLGFPEQGIAVAHNHSVIPRSGWAARLCELPDSSGPMRLEVVTAVQGG